ncbi:TetR/AcrR family transcriptional regulator [Asticcacaulis solisilvae]|uniref:TetR/AcrR family transcriptional regulator n=1 Tax=Asticcacaulis solisilvae TaxID=1217274 RepID=UPI003FD73905
MTTDTQALKKQEILDRAERLFYCGGFHATGVDTVLADSGISKRTLYKYFASKEELIEAVLDRYAGNVETVIFDPALARTDDPRGRILAVFDVRRDLMNCTAFAGCLAMKAAEEYKDRHPGIEAAGRRSVDYVKARFVELCRLAGYDDPEGTGAMVALLLQGAVLTSQLRRDTEAFEAAKAAAERLLR